MAYKLVLVLAEVFKENRKRHEQTPYVLDYSTSYHHLSLTLESFQHQILGLPHSYLHTFLSHHLINSENESPLYLLGETSHCILLVISHYDSLNQLSSLVWIFLVSHLEYLTTLIALTLAFSLSDVTQRTSRFSFENAYVIMSLLWLTR